MGSRDAIHVCAGGSRGSPRLETGRAGPGSDPASRRALSTPGAFPRPAPAAPGSQVLPWGASLSPRPLVRIPVCKASGEGSACRVGIRNPAEGFLSVRW